MVCPAGWGFGEGGSAGGPAAASLGSKGRGQSRDRDGGLRGSDDLSPKDGRTFLRNHGN